MHVALSDHQANLLLGDLHCSTWVAPPSLKPPAVLDHCILAMPLGTTEPFLQVIKRAWTQALIRKFGREVVFITLKIFGSRATLANLFKVNRYHQILSARIKEHPQLASILSVDQSLWPDLHNWRIVKLRLVALGLKPSAWRWLTRQKRGYVSLVDFSDLSHLRWVNVHSEIHTHLPVALLEKQTLAIRGMGACGTWLRRQADSLASPAAKQFFRVLRLCLRRMLAEDTRENVEEIVREELPLVTDWLLANLNDLATNNQGVNRKWTYDTLIARQAHWHVQDWRHDKQQPNVFWSEYLGQGCLQAGVEFIELCSLNALLQEAKRMHHCVPSYIDRCMEGEIALFHLWLKRPMNEHATLEIGKIQPTGWKINQLKGPCNGPVSSSMWLAANQLIAMLS